MSRYRRSTQVPGPQGPTEPLWPRALTSWALAGVAGLMLLVALALWAGGLDPARAAPWWLWPLAGLARLVGRGGAALIFLAGVAALVALPWWAARPRRLWLGLGLAGLALWALLAWWGWR